MKKTGILPKGKVDMRFVLPIFRVITIDNKEFAKLEYFVGYKLENTKEVKFTKTEGSYLEKSKLLIKVLTGEQKGYLYKGKFNCLYAYSFDEISFGKVEKYVKPEKVDGVWYLKGMDDLYTLSKYQNHEQMEKFFTNYPKTATWQELSDMVAAQNIELEEMMRGARMELAAKVAKRQKIEKENNKIFE